MGSNPPTGKKWNVRGAQVVILAGNKIKELRQYFDMNTIAQQLQ
jgi:predicted ester cyclase